LKRLAPALAAALLATSISAAEPPRQGGPFPRDKQIPVVDLQGRPLDLRQVVPPGEGSGRAALVVFWASWCQPCIREIPEINELHRFYKERGLSVVGLGIQWGGDTIEDVAEAVAMHGVKYPVLFDAQDRARELFGITALPAAALVDSKGTLRWFGTQLPKDINERIRAAIEPEEERGPE